MSYLIKLPSAFAQGKTTETVIADLKRMTGLEVREEKLDQMIDCHLTSVAPMKGPAGKIFEVKFRYSERNK